MKSRKVSGSGSAWADMPGGAGLGRRGPGRQRHQRPANDRQAGRRTVCRRGTRSGHQATGCGYPRGSDAPAAVAWPCDQWTLGFAAGQVPSVSVFARSATMALCGNLAVNRSRREGWPRYWPVGARRASTCGSRTLLAQTSRTRRRRRGGPPFVVDGRSAATKGAFLHTVATACAFRPGSVITGMRLPTASPTCPGRRRIAATWLSTTDGACLRDRAAELAFAPVGVQRGVFTLGRHIHADGGSVEGSWSRRRPARTQLTS